jgi:hypothetical protein
MTRGKRTAAVLGCVVGVASGVHGARAVADLPPLGPPTWGPGALLVYLSSDAPPDVTGSNTDAIFVNKSGVLVIMQDREDRSGRTRRTWRARCIRSLELRRLRRVLTSAIQVPGPVVARSYLRRGLQILEFGRDGDDRVLLRPRPALPELRAPALRALVRAAEHLRRAAGRGVVLRPKPGLRLACRRGPGGRPELSQE